MKDENDDIDPAFEKQLNSVLDYVQKHNPPGANQQENNRADKRVTELIQSANLPKRHASAGDLNSNPHWAEKFEDLKHELSNGFLACLTGIRGNGKTQMAVALCIEAARRQRTALYSSATDFFMDIKATYQQQSKATEQDVINRYRKPRLLVLDEIAKRSGTDWEDHLLFTLINRRYEDMTDTLTIANLDVAGVEDSIGPSLKSRMDQCGSIIECNWSTFRIPRTFGRNLVTRFENQNSTNRD